jgi:hypothetical protein
MIEHSRLSNGTQGRTAGLLNVQSPGETWWEAIDGFYTKGLPSGDFADSSVKNVLEGP